MRALDQLGWTHHGYETTANPIAALKVCLSRRVPAWTRLLQVPKIDRAARTCRDVSSNPGRSKARTLSRVMGHPSLPATVLTRPRGWPVDPAVVVSFKVLFLQSVEDVHEDCKPAVNNYLKKTLKQNPLHRVTDSHSDYKVWSVW